jgi:hypothetical protein
VLAPSSVRAARLALGPRYPLLLAVLGAASCCGAVLGVTATARADASVRVELRHKDGRSADGNVALSHGSHVLRCVTQGGACVIAASEGGSYTVQVELSGAPSPKPKTVMIPPSGNVKLVVAVD